MAWFSTVPVVLDALAAEFKSALSTAGGFDGVVVFDGPTVTEGAPTEAVTVGYHDDEVTSVDGEDTREGLSTQRSRERYTVNCAAAVLTGSGDIRAARARAYDILNVLGSALAVNPTLGQSAMSVQPGSMTLTQTQDTDGAVAVVMFGVDVDAFTRL
ncbi:hypothetical protein RVR_8315 [Actinacidiphila reveromycinica]|uniref:Uncharacterized protein n=1 Tax=Actinacidiphila reveromycinica TaxID=659352 RepID=A0A7U3UYR5_9ACTN|nr:hypothetical protein [Streptomyces sp. SN-593]BBB01072.1 hypothetical protein RVR_8315 [Streptomyces sp. SN-593]